MRIWIFKERCIWKGDQLCGAVQWKIFVKSLISLMTRTLKGIFSFLSLPLANNFESNEKVWINPVFVKKLLNPNPLWDYIKLRQVSQILNRFISIWKTIDFSRTMLHLLMLKLVLNLIIWSEAQFNQINSGCVCDIQCVYIFENIPLSDRWKSWWWGLGRGGWSTQSYSALLILNNDSEKNIDNWNNLTM